MTDKRINKLKRKLQEARYRLLTREPELAAPLVEMLFVTNVDVRRMSTNGSCIYFDASWLEKLDDNSLDFALCHQLMHIRLGHLSRPQFYKGDRFHFACNIVVNSSLIRYDFTDDKLPGIGEIHHETFYPKVEGCELTPYEAFQMTPLDPSTLSDAQRRNLLLDSDEWWDRPNARTEDGVLILSPDDPDPDDLIPSERIRGIIERVCKGFRKQEMPEVYRPEADDDDELDDLIFEYTTRPSANLKEAIREIRGSKDRDAENYDSSTLCERVLHRSKITTHDWQSVFEDCLRQNRDVRYAANNLVRTLLAQGKNGEAQRVIQEHERFVSKDLKKRAEKPVGKVKIAVPEPAVTDVEAETIVDIGVKKQQFSSEKLLEDELVQRMEIGIPVFGMPLRMYQKRGVYGRQFVLRNGRLDILGIDTAGDLYVIELKKDSGYDDAYAQTREYIDWIEEDVAVKGQRVFGIICLNDPTKDLIEKVKADDQMRLFEYSISYSEII